MRITLSRICLASLLGAILFAILPLHAADRDDRDQQVIAVVYPVADFPVWSIGNGNPQFDPSLLIAHIKASVYPDSWEKDDRRISSHPTTASLVVRQTRPNHLKVAQLLSDHRRKHPGKQIERIERGDPVREIDGLGVTQSTQPVPAKEDR